MSVQLNTTNVDQAAIKRYPSRICKVTRRFHFEDASQRRHKRKRKAAKEPSANFLRKGKSNKAEEEETSKNVEGTTNI